MCALWPGQTACTELTFMCSKQPPNISPKGVISMEDCKCKQLHRPPIPHLYHEEAEVGGL